MADLYPILVQPEFHERVWGSRDLSPIYNHNTAESEPIGEVWLTGDACKVANGPLTGQPLAEVCRQFGAAFVGDAAPQLDRFPLLIKFLFPREKLSVQVHPDDAGAQRLGQPCGKTECWYVLSARPHAQVGLGLKKGVNRHQVEEAIRDQRLEFLLNWVEVEPGDMLYVDAGTVHAIGPGSVLVETQQNSDTTYRLYDYGRPRELHLEKGLEAMKETTHAGKVAPVRQGNAVNLVSSPSFLVDRYALEQPQEFTAPEGERTTAQIFVGLGGCGVIEAEGCSPVSFAQGEAVIVPASLRRFTLRPQWQVQCLRSALPTQATSHPITIAGTAAVIGAEGRA